MSYNLTLTGNKKAQTEKVANLISLTASFYKNRIIIERLLGLRRVYED
jgi:hypothetical protein